MKESKPTFWSSASNKEKCAIITLGVIFVGILLFVSGIAVGRAIATLM